MARIRAAVRAVRAVDPEFAAVVARRWAGLPQTRDANRVGVDGPHTMALGRQWCQADD